MDCKEVIEQINTGEVEAALEPIESWAHQCHAASIALVRSGVLGECRVARGTCAGVGSQHSWVVVGNDCYDDEALIIDPTLWSYDESVRGIWYGTYAAGRHKPFGKGNIFDWGRPDNAAPGEAYELRPSKPWSREAERFLSALGPLDIKGWTVLAHAPVENWPSKEIITAIAEDPKIGARVPIDIVGMATDLNPSGLYLPTKED